MVFQFEHVGLDHGDGGKFDPRDFGVSTLKRSLQRWQDGLAATGWNSLYWNNHDQPRAVSRFGDDGEYWSQSARALAAVLHLQRGTPYIYQGEELGMTNAPFPELSSLRDIESLNYFAHAMGEGGATVESVLEGIRRSTRDNARTPMQWSADAGAGFTSGEAWIAANPNHVRINAADQVGRDGSVFEFYRELVRLRHRDPVVAYGEFRMLAVEHPALVAFCRSLGERRLLLLANFGRGELDAGTVVDLGEWAGARLVLGNYPPGSNAPSAVAAPLRPWEVRVLRDGPEPRSAGDR
jgi:oligo-1,6-glucosidase